MTLHETAVELRRIAAEVREVAARVDGVYTARWAAARDLRATAHTLDRIADVADRAAADEPAVFA
jgi:hypothetical protein